MELRISYLSFFRTYGGEKSQKPHIPAPLVDFVAVLLDHIVARDDLGEDMRKKLEFQLEKKFTTMAYNKGPITYDVHQNVRFFWLPATSLIMTLTINQPTLCGYPKADV